ncbi:MAG: hypothetical protein ACI4KL_02280 [Lentihominibacter sp.]
MLILDKVWGIRNASMETIEDESAGTSRITIEPSDENLRERIFRAFAGESVPLISMYRQKPSLEEVYLSLVEEGTFAVGAQATYTASETEDSDGDDSDSDSGDVVTGTLTVFGSSSLIDESLTGSFTGLDNNTLFMNAVTTPIGGSENNVAIEAKSLETQYNTPSHPGLFSILIIFIIPIAVMILGFVSWMKRRKR